MYMSRWDTPDTSAMPATPATPPLMSITSQICFVMEMPDCRAASGFAPSSRSSYPHFNRLIMSA
ncbi:hypothetical protein D3C72_2582550 [compost metagenome]